ncbi:hypothetical protein DFH09DRAFT_1447324 [Mycena vulgaris]|nr:hypothetical protein DFH09DRAFT_1447324 [Mycena vulgaris]
MKTVAFKDMDMTDLPFRLNITRTGCEYDDKLSALASTVGSLVSDGMGERLRQWYEETKVDPAVRDAREIPVSEFSVSDDLITRVQELWGASFFPRHVRAQPYKIHLYEPGGKFKAHRDTPETDLVGTFLLGLGDTSKTEQGGQERAFEIKSEGAQWTRHTAHLGSWVAFYLDVDHAVREIHSGHRAVIAFKIFRQHLDNRREVPSPAEAKLRNEIKDVLMQLQKPYGIHLQHHYSAGTAELNGFDAALHATADETGGLVKLLPVLISWSAYYESYGRGGRDVHCSADVFPITETHVDTVLAHIGAGGKQTSGELFVDLKGIDAEWINHHSTESIPFYTPRFSATSITWKEDVEDAIETRETNPGLTRKTASI